jgi:hypothetical protein
MKYIINYSSGGLGNRLIPLLCIMELCEKLNRNVGVIWPETMRCMGHFKNLFSNQITEFKINNLDPLETVIYSNHEFITYDASLNNNDELLNLSYLCQVKNLNSLSEIYNEDKKYIVIYHNTSFLEFDSIPKQLKSLKVTDYIENKINDFVNEYKINKSTIGIHARSTDFINENLSKYTQLIENILVNNPESKILFCSDDVTWESSIKTQFPKNIIIRQKKDYVKKFNDTLGWVNNVYTSEESTIEGLIDIYLLSKTNFLHYNPESTFAKLSIYLQNEL